MARQVLITGAGSAIAQALAEQLAQDPEVTHLHRVSRSALEPIADAQAEVTDHTSDYSDRSLKGICESVARSGNLTEVIICHGLLHRDDGIFPEKKLADLTSQSFLALMEVNALLPARWLQQLQPGLRGKAPCTIAIFSARVGSLSDNRLGGWYSYRSSKAALNMLVRTASIEYARIAPNVRFLLFQPGTTDTPLSKPFQGNVPEGDLLAPAFVAERLQTVMKGLPEGSGVYFKDFEGETVPW